MPRIDIKYVNGSSTTEISLERDDEFQVVVQAISLLMGVLGEATRDATQDAIRVGAAALNNIADMFSRTRGEADGT